MQSTHQPVRSAYSIFVQTLCDGLVPAWYDERSFPVVYDTELEAQRELANNLIEHLHQFLDGEREFGDAISIDDLILPVNVWPDGSISTEDGSIFGRRC